MNTSYFDKIQNNPNVVSIAGRCPDWFIGKQYKKLAPKYWFFKKFKDKNDIRYLDQKFYIEMYMCEVLNKLDALEVYNDLGEDAILTCWEKPEEFCHRHVVANWLNNKLKLNISEL
jgi:uncharacterized protein (DUF488 family)